MACKKKDERSSHAALPRHTVCHSGNIAGYALGKRLCIEIGIVCHAHGIAGSKEKKSCTERDRESRKIHGGIGLLLCFKTQDEGISHYGYSPCGALLRRECTEKGKHRHGGTAFSFLLRAFYEIEKQKQEQNRIEIIERACRPIDALPRDIKRNRGKKQA